MLDNKKNSQPLYIQIKNHIKGQLENKIYDVGDILPTESDYQKQFGVSRITVRNAINELVTEGYLTRTRGKGTTVSFKKLNEIICRGSNFTEEMKQFGLKAFTWAVSVSIIKSDSLISEKLGIPKGEHALKVERLRGTEEYPIVYFETYFSMEKNMPIDKDMYKGSINDTIRRYCGINWRTDLYRMSDHFEAIQADTDLAKKLDVELNTPVLKRSSQTCDKNDHVFDFTVCYYRGDKFSCTVTYK